MFMSAICSNCGLYAFRATSTVSSNLMSNARVSLRGILSHIFFVRPKNNMDKPNKCSIPNQTGVPMKYVTIVIPIAKARVMKPRFMFPRENREEIPDIKTNNPAKM